MTSKPSTRRGFLLKLGGAIGATLAATYIFRTPIADLILTNTIKNDILPSEGPSFLDSDACILTPQSSEGPYYIDEDYMGDVLLRSDVRDGKPGVDLRLKFKVVDAATCEALAGVAVDIWSCDAAGYYSGHADASPDAIPFAAAFSGHATPTSPDRALRGRQITDEAGFVEFLTIFPGWYKPRTVHLHIMVVDQQQKIAITQIFFPQALIDEIHAGAPYRDRGASPYTNLNDSLINETGVAAGFPKMAQEGAGYSGTLTIGVQQPS